MLGNRDISSQNFASATTLSLTLSFFDEDVEQSLWVLAGHAAPVTHQTAAATEGASPSRSLSQSLVLRGIRRGGGGTVCNINAVQLTVVVSITRTPRTVKIIIVTFTVIYLFFNTFCLKHFVRIPGFHSELARSEQPGCQSHDTVKYTQFANDKKNTEKRFAPQRALTSAEHTWSSRRSARSRLPYVAFPNLRRVWKQRELFSQLSCLQ